MITKPSIQALEAMPMTLDKFGRVHKKTANYLKRHGLLTFKRQSVGLSSKGRAVLNACHILRQKTA